MYSTRQRGLQSALHLCYADWVAVRLSARLWAAPWWEALHCCWWVLFTADGQMWSQLIKRSYSTPLQPFTRCSSYYNAYWSVIFYVYQGLHGSLSLQILWMCDKLILMDLGIKFLWKNQTEPLLLWTTTLLRTRWYKSPSNSVVAL